jgi:hypothetical protein
VGNILNFIIILLPFFISSCAHVTFLEPRENWIGHRIFFNDYSFEIPDDPKWYVLNAHKDSQSIVLVVPDLENTYARRIIKDDKEIGIVLAKRGLLHPEFSKFYQASIELFLNYIPHGFKNYSDEELINKYLDDEIAYNLQKGLVSAGSPYRVFEIELEGSQKYKCLELKLDKKNNSILIVACSIYNNSKRFFITGKLWSRDTTEKYEGFFIKLLSNIKAI